MELRSVAEEIQEPVPELLAVDKASAPEVVRARTLRNKRAQHAARAHELLVEHHSELLTLHRSAVGRYLAVAAADVTAVAESSSPLPACKAEPLVIGMTTDLPYPKVGLVGVDKDITTARPGTSHRRGKRAVQPRQPRCPPARPRRTRRT